MNVLCAWIGETDLKASAGDLGAGRGPIGASVVARKFDRVELLDNWRDDRSKRYLPWLRKLTIAGVGVHPARLSSPTAMPEIYAEASGLIERVLKDDPNSNLTFQFSAGTPAMAAIWLLLAKGRYRAELIQSSPQRGVETAHVPFEISADFNPDLLKQPDEDLVRLVQGLPPENADFRKIVHKCDAMKRVLAQARRLAPRNVPVLILGETGTGKELLALAIHHASGRSKCPLLTVNCGAIPEGLVDSTLFGHAKGAFTGAIKDSAGCFENAHSGTLFLDEVGELPPAVQVRLLRVLQEGRIVRVGEFRERPVDVRVVAATNRDLFQDMADSRFREDLMYRLAVGVLHVPSLRDRPGDLDLLIDSLLDGVQKEAASQPDFERRALSAGARVRLHRHTWPGNVRELRNTLLRASILATGLAVTAKDVEGALMAVKHKHSEAILGRPLGSNLKLKDLISEVARHYLDRAMEEAGGNKNQAAKLLGFSAQTFTNWLKRHGLRLS